MSLHAEFLDVLVQAATEGTCLPCVSDDPYKTRRMCCSIGTEGMPDNCISNSCLLLTLLQYGTASYSPVATTGKVVAMPQCLLHGCASVGDLVGFAQSAQDPGKCSAQRRAWSKLL